MLKIITFHQISPVYVVIKGNFWFIGMFVPITSLRSKEFAGVLLLHLHWGPNITYTTFQRNSFAFAFNMLPHKFGRPFSRSWMVQHARQTCVTCCTQSVIVGSTVKSRFLCFRIIEIERRYEFYVLVARTISHEWVQRTSGILLLRREHKMSYLRANV